MLATEEKASAGATDDVLIRELQQDDSFDKVLRVREWSARDLVDMETTVHSTRANVQPDEYEADGAGMKICA